MLMFSKIRIVDDILENINLLQNILQQADFETYTSTNGIGAVEVSKNVKFDIMLIDVRMPEMDGIEAYKKIKKNSLNSGTPVLFLIAKTDTVNISAAFREGCVDIITKPFQTDELLARINTHIILEEQKNKLKELIATKDRFISLLAHDLKNSINPIIGFSRLLSQNIAIFNLEEIKKYIGIIHKTSENTHDLLINLLTWASSQQNSIPFQPEKINLYLIINQSYLLLKNLAISKDLLIKIEVDENIFIFADNEMIKTILRNLIANAIKYTPASGIITLKAKMKETVIEIKVTDTGIGMDEKTKNSLFNMVETKSIKGLEGEEGTGFGLILCKDFVEKHGGKIWVESELGIGSNFMFTLPMTND